MYQPDEHFMAVGRDQIRDWALGTEMAGLEGWSYPYVSVVIDEKQGMVIGFWRQVSPVDSIEIAGIGGSWFGYAGGGQWAWQRDWFDLNSAGQAFLSILESGRASDGMVARMGLHGPTQPGHYAKADLPAPIWPPTAGRAGFEPPGEKPSVETNNATSSADPGVGGPVGGSVRSLVSTDVPSANAPVTARPPVVEC